MLLLKCALDQVFRCATRCGSLFYLRMQGLRSAGVDLQRVLARMCLIKACKVVQCLTIHAAWLVSLEELFFLNLVYPVASCGGALAGLQVMPRCSDDQF